MSDSGQNGITLLHERLTRLEERGDHRDKKLDRIEGTMTELDAKVDALMNDMREIKLAWKIGSGIGAKIAGWVPAGAIGAGLTWLAAHFLPGK